MIESENAAAFKLQQDGGDIAALIIENVQAAATRAGRDFEPVDLTAGIGALLSAAWQMAKAAGPDDATAKQFYVELLRRHADSLAAMY